MKLKYMGTAAAEGFPAVFCRCKYCLEARRLGGKNIRTRSQSLVNDDLLIDFPPDAYSHFLSNGIEGDKIKYLLVTHSHRDHFDPLDLDSRYGAFAHDMTVPTLLVVGSKETLATLGKVPFGVATREISAFETLELDNYKITAFPARHMGENGGAFVYLIRGEKSILYLHDTGYPYESVLDYLKDNSVKVDLVSFDCTNVDIPISDKGGHMGFDNIGRLLSHLREVATVDEHTLCYVNHFSHNGNPLHENLTRRAEEYGCLVAYDGCTVEI